MRNRFIQYFVFNAILTVGSNLLRNIVSYFTASKIKLIDIYSGILIIFFSYTCFTLVTKLKTSNFPTTV